MMMKINPTIVEANADEMQRINTELFTLYEEILNCISQLGQMKGLDKQIHFLDLTNRDLFTQTEDEKRYAQTLLTLTEYYVASDNRAVSRGEGSVPNITTPVSGSRIRVPTYQTGIIF